MLSAMPVHTSCTCWEGFFFQMLGVTLLRQFGFLWSQTLMIWAILVGAQRCWHGLIDSSTRPVVVRPKLRQSFTPWPYNEPDMEKTVAYLFESTTTAHAHKNVAYKQYINEMDCLQPAHISTSTITSNSSLTSMIEILT